MVKMGENILVTLDFQASLGVTTDIVRLLFSKLRSRNCSSSAICGNLQVHWQGWSVRLDAYGGVELDKYSQNGAKGSVGISLEPCNHPSFVIFHA